MPRVGPTGEAKRARGEISLTAKADPVVPDRVVERHPLSFVLASAAGPFIAVAGHIPAPEQRLAARPLVSGPQPAKAHAKVLRLQAAAVAGERTDCAVEAAGGLVPFLGRRQPTL